MRFANYGELTGHGRTELRADALAIAAAGLRAADPAELARALRSKAIACIVRGAPIAARRRDHEGGDAADAMGLTRPARPTVLTRPRGRESVTAVDLAGRRLFLLGAGKASLGMAEVLDELLGPRFADAAVVVKRGQAQHPSLRHIEVLEAAHPCPTRRAWRAGCVLQALPRRARSERPRHRLW